MLLAGDTLWATFGRLGDVDNDGYDDFFAGAPSGFVGGSGYVFLFFGAPRVTSTSQ